MSTLFRFLWHLIRFNWGVVLLVLVPVIAIGILTVGSGVFGASGTVTASLGLLWTFFTGILLMVLAPLAAVVILAWTILKWFKPEGLGSTYGNIIFYTALGVIATALFVTVIPIQNNPFMIPKLLLAFLALTLIAVFKTKKGDVFVGIVKWGSAIVAFAWILSLVFPSASAIAGNSKALIDKGLAETNDKLQKMLDGQEDEQKSVLGMAMCGATTPMCGDTPTMALAARRGIVKIPLHPCWRTIVTPDWWEYNWWQPSTGVGFWASQWSGPIWIPYGESLHFRYVRTFKVCGKGTFTLELYQEGEAAPRPGRRAPSQDEDYENESDASDESDTGEPGDMSCKNATPMYIGSIKNTPIVLEESCFHLTGDANHNFALSLETGSAEVQKQNETEFVPLDPNKPFEAGNNFLIRGNGRVRASRE